MAKNGKKTHRNHGKITAVYIAANLLRQKCIFTAPPDVYTKVALMGRPGVPINFDTRISGNLY